jgi:radical SAM superfamily enzyme YgiQ (UPF0313 family)
MRMEKSVPIISYAVQSHGPVLSGMMLDNGVALIAAHLIRGGFAPKVFDYNSLRTVERLVGDGRERFLESVREELCAYVARTRAAIVGFKLYANGFADAVRLAWELKRRFPNVRVVGGGPHVEWFGETVLAYAERVHGADVFDALTYGDADTTMTRLCELAHGTGTLGDIPNLIFRAPTGELRRTRRVTTSLDDLPHPIYEPEVYDTAGKLLIPVIEDSRSCDNACTFCVHPRIGGKRRTRALQRVVEEIEHNRQQYGFKVFRLSGPRPSSEYINALSGALPEDARFSAFGYCDPNYNAAVTSGKVMGLFIGIESADARILHRHRKTTDVDAYLAAARDVTALFKAHGLATVASMIMPSPDESTASMQRSLDFLRELQPDFAPVQPIGPIPGTPLTRLAHTDPEHAGVMLEEDYALKLIRYELDLVKPPAEWPPAPLKVRVNGAFRDPFEITAQFSAELVASGLHPLGDEQVLMAYLYHGGLSAEQTERREQCLSFNRAARQALQAGDLATLRRLVGTVNEHQRRGFPSPRLERPRRT